MGSRGEVPCLGLGDEIPNVPMREAHITGNRRGTGACRAQWAKQAGGASGIARSACATMRVPRAPKATITILIHFDRMFSLISTGCALRWAQKDEGGYSDPPYIPLDSHYPSETLGRYKNRYSSQAPFPAHAGEQVATVLWRSGEWSEGSKSF